MLLACATTDMVLTLALSDVEENAMQYRSRVVIFDLFPGDVQGSYESKLDVLGQWYVDGSIEGLGLHREADSE